MRAPRWGAAVLMAVRDCLLELCSGMVSSAEATEGPQDPAVGQEFEWPARLGQQHT